MNKKLCTVCGRIHTGQCKGKKTIGYKDIEYTSFLHSMKWRKKREYIIQRDNYYCQRCLIKFNKIVSSDLQVHHIIPRIDTLNEKHLWLEDSNLITLCKSCNTFYGERAGLDFDKEEKKNGVEPII